MFCHLGSGNSSVSCFFKSKIGLDHPDPDTHFFTLQIWTSSAPIGLTFTMKTMMVVSHHVAVFGNSIILPYRADAETNHLNATHSWLRLHKWEISNSRQSLISCILIPSALCVWIRVTVTAQNKVTHMKTLQYMLMSRLYNNLNDCQDTQPGLWIRAA